MNSLPFDDLEETIKTLHLDLNTFELSTLNEEHGFSTEQMSAIDQVFTYLREKKRRNTIEMYLRTSRLPLKVPKGDCHHFDASLHFFKTYLKKIRIYR